MVAMGGSQTFGGDRKPVRPTGKVTITFTHTVTGIGGGEINKALLSLLGMLQPIVLQLYSWPRAEVEAVGL